MSYDDLNEKEELILRHLITYCSEHGYPPSIREICTNTGIKSTSTVQRYYGFLEEKGYIKRSSFRKRCLEINYDKLPNELAIENGLITSDTTVSVPVIGTIAAGEPILAVENIDYYMPISSELIGTGEPYILKVKGESMVDLGIIDGDFIVVSRTNTADNGDIVVAMINDSATVKKFYKEDGYFRLQPANALMDPILVTELSILGIVTASFRIYK